MILAKAQQLDGRPVLILGITPDDWASLLRREAVSVSADVVEADTGIDIGLALFAGINEVEISTAIIRAWRATAEAGRSEQPPREPGAQ